GQFLELFRSFPEVDKSLHNEHHHGRVKRFAEGFFCVEDTMHTLIANGFSSSTQSLSLQARIVDTLKKSTYFNGLPDLLVACPELDGTADSSPIIFEEGYFPLATSARASRLPSTDAPEPLHKNRRSSGSRFSPEKVARALKSSLCLDLRHLNKPASFGDDDVYLMASKSTDDAEPNGPATTQTAAAPDDVHLLSVEPDRCASTSPTLSDVSFVPPPTYPTGNRNVVRRSTEPNLVFERERETSFLDSVGMGRAHSDSAVNGVTLLLSDSAVAPFECGRPKESGNQQIPVVHDSSSLCCMPICSQTSRQQSQTSQQPCKETKKTKEADDDDEVIAPVAAASVEPHLLSRVDDTVIEFVRNKEQFKEKLSLSGYDGHLCSDFAQLASRIPYFTRWDPHSSGHDHLIVCVHGLDGSTDDLRPYRTYLKLALLGNVSFLMSEANHSETFNDMTAMASNLVDELLAHLEGLPAQPKRISFIAHSLGTVITRAALADPRVAHLRDKMHCFLSLNGPHCGLLYNQRAANWGVSLVQWWKRSRSLEQLTMRDQPITALRDSFLYRLSQNGSLAAFRYVLLVGSNQDMYVPCHSALVQPCKDAQKDSSPFGAVYGELVTNIVESVAGSARHTTLVKYTAFHGMANVSRTHQIMGRAAHIAVLDDDLFIEKLLTVSALKYFV
uniref:DUF676 domain-containing protein n=1 Tax=Plectus sambesii TaxID=2011161 RepID=A0A914XP22_9BILA